MSTVLSLPKRVEKADCVFSDIKSNCDCLMHSTFLLHYSLTTYIIDIEIYKWKEICLHSVYIFKTQNISDKA